jgi:4-hydroxy-tetrahydrodipicolinate synthase
MKKILFEGVATAIITPFTENDEIDYLSFKNLIHKQLESKVDAIVILGTTGEPCTISTNERKIIIVFAINEGVFDRTPLFN